jgi:hypothetical protein
LSCRLSLSDHGQPGILGGSDRHLLVNQGVWSM